MSNDTSQTGHKVERRVNLRRSTDIAEIRMLYLDEVMQTCAIGRTSVYDGVSRGQFPPPVQLLTRAARWVNHDIQRWLSFRIASSRRNRPSADSRNNSP